jgi:hypothetical protein
VSSSNRSNVFEKKKRDFGSLVETLWLVKASVIFVFVKDLAKVTRFVEAEVFRIATFVVCADVRRFFAMLVVPNARLDERGKAMSFPRFAVVLEMRITTRTFVDAFYTRAEKHRANTVGSNASLFRVAERFLVRDSKLCLIVENTHLKCAGSLSESFGSASWHKQELWNRIVHSCTNKMLEIDHNRSRFSKKNRNPSRICFPFIFVLLIFFYFP